MGTIWDDGVVADNGILQSNDPEAWKRVGEAIRRRREELQITQREAGRAARVSVTNWNKLENGLKDKTRGLTASRVESFLNWEHGSIKALLEEGCEPTAFEDPLPEAELKSLRAMVLHQQDVIDDLLAWREAMSKIVKVPK